MSSSQFNVDSLQKIVPNLDQVVVYGWRSCKYIELTKFLDFDFDAYAWKSWPKKFSADWVEKTDDIQLYERRICKAVIVDVVFQNFKKAFSNKPFTPLIFCVDIEGRVRKVSNEHIASRSADCNDIVTHKELRRCAKICVEIESDKYLKAIAETAKMTIKFVRLVGSDQSGYSFEEVQPFWEAKDWKDAWDKRMKTAKQSKEKNPIEWKRVLKEKMFEFLAKNHPTNNRVESKDSPLSTLTIDETLP